MPKSAKPFKAPKAAIPKPSILGKPLLGPGTPGALSGALNPVKAMRPVTAQGSVRPATAAIGADRIASKVKRPVRTKVPRV